MNSFGRNFRISLFGESHGTALGVVIDGVPPGMPLTVNDFAEDLARRQGRNADGGFKERSVGVTPRVEPDQPEILSGLHNGHTTGAPMAITFHNTNTRSGDYTNLITHPRPSHADLVAAQKFGGQNDPRGGGHFSGRVTVAMVAAGVVAKKILNQAGIAIESQITEIGGSNNPHRFEAIIAEAITQGDSVGGVIECRAKGLPAGLGEPFFDSVESLAAHLLFAIPGVKGVEFGNGFAASRLRGSQNNDPITSADGTTASNNAGGINGGITNGNQIVARVAIKPTASIAQPQNTINLTSGRMEPLQIKGRHDACITLRASVVTEAALAITLADLMLTSYATSRLF